MLQSASTHTMIAVSDLEVAREFYGAKLGLTASDDRPGTAIRYEVGAGTWFLVYRSRFAGTAKSTCMRFEVENLEDVAESFVAAESSSRSTTCRG